MNDNKRYYWIKLKTDFFNQETIDFLLSQKNGCEYIVLYQMLCLNTANNNGEMCSKIGEMIVPYNVDKIVRDTKYFDFDTVTIALGLFKQLGLVYEEEEDKILKITNFDEMVGSEVSSARRVRKFRERQKALQCNNDVTQEIDIRDKSIDKDIDNTNNKPMDTFCIQIGDTGKDSIELDKNSIEKERKYYDESNLNNIFIEFLELRKKLKAVNSDRAINTLLNILSKYDDDAKYKMIETSIVNSWKSIYPLKENKKVPEWINKKQQIEKMNDDELKELEEEFKQFKGE